MLRHIRSVPPLTMTKARLKRPRHQRNQHEGRRRPSNSKELAALLRLDPDLSTVLIQHIAALDDHGRDQPAREANGQERKSSEHDVQTGRETPATEHGRERGDERDEDQPDGNAVQDEDGPEHDAQGVDAALDVGGPVEVVERDADARLVEGALEDFGRVEGVHCRGVGACRDVFVDCG